MNIAYILNSTAANGGATKAVLNMLDGLMPKGIVPFVVVPDRDGVFHELQRRHIKTLVATYRPSAYPASHTFKQRLLFIPKLAARVISNHRATKVLTNWLRENHIDLVHSNTGIVRIGFDAAQETGIPHIYHIREYRDKDFNISYFPSSGSFYQQLEKPDSYSICITKDIQHYHRQDHKPTSRIIYDGVFPALPSMPLASAKDYFLFAGRLQQAKGADQLLKAYKMYCDQTKFPLPLKIAGSYSNDHYCQSLLTFIRDNNLTGKVELLGDRNDITDLMREARALIVASPFEGFGFCMPEAQQQGCLVIARNTSGTKEQLDNALQMTGQEIALRYTTTEELAAWLTKVADVPAGHYRPYTETAFQVVNQLYTKENNVRQVLSFYHDILKTV